MSWAKPKTSAAPLWAEAQQILGLGQLPHHGTGARMCVFSAIKHCTSAWWIIPLVREGQGPSALYFTPGHEGVGKSSPLGRQARPLEQKPPLITDPGPGSIWNLVSGRCPLQAWASLGRLGRGGSLKELKDGFAPVAFTLHGREVHRFPQPRPLKRMLLAVGVSGGGAEGLWEGRTGHTVVGG